MAPGVGISTIFGMEKVRRVLNRLLRGGPILDVASAIPTCPDAWRVNVHDVLAKITASNRGGTRGIQFVAESVQFRHEGPDRFRVESLKVARPVVLIAKPPENHRGVVVMLVDHVAQHVAALLAESLSTESAPAPRDFLPHQQAKFIAEVEHKRSLLVVAQADEVGAHFFHERECLSNDCIRHCGRHAGVILVIMGSPEKESLPVYFERPVFDPFHGSDSKAVDHLLPPILAGEGDAAPVEFWRVGTPEFRAVDAELSDFLQARPRR